MRKLPYPVWAPPSNKWESVEDGIAFAPLAGVTRGSRSGAPIGFAPLAGISRGSQPGTPIVFAPLAGVSWGSRSGPQSRLHLWLESLGGVGRAPQSRLRLWLGSLGGADRAPGSRLRLWLGSLGRAIGRPDRVRTSGWGRSGGPAESARSVTPPPGSSLPRRLGQIGRPVQHIVPTVYISEVGGKGASAAPTGKSFRFVRACERRRARRSNYMSGVR